MKIESQSNMRKLRKIAKDFFRDVLILGAIWLTYEYSKDYCFEQRRKLTDKEYLSIVLNSLLKSGLMQTHSWDNMVDTYLAHHPDCCGVHRNDDLFDSAVVVEITYEMSNEGKKYYAASKDTHYIDLSGLTACGEYLESTGETTTLPTNKTHSIN